MKLLLVLAATFLMFGCDEKKPENGGPMVTSGDSTAAIVKPEMTKTQYLNLATTSTCAKTNFTSQGVPKAGYLKGIALTYAKTVCNSNGDTFKVASQSLGNANIDALTHYGVKATTPIDRLNTTFSLAIGSGARESTWRWYVGKDASASNTTADTCEAGYHQTSYNCKYNRDGVTINPERAALYKYFKADKSRCFADEYKNGTKGDAANLKNWGTGEGVIFQELSKQCPGFAVEYHLMAIRMRITHYGPLKTKAAEIKPACTDMFVQLNKTIKDNPSLCNSL